MLEAVTAAMPDRITGSNGISSLSPLHPNEMALRKAELYNETAGGMSGVDCPVCKNKGNVMRADESGKLCVVECECMTQRRSVWAIERSGLGNLLERYTIETWQTPKPWHEQMKRAVEQFAEHPNGWFYIAGRPGTGKTHLCTALCALLMKKNMETRYLVWRDFSVKAKACVTDAEEYAKLLRPFRNAKVLYVDDLFKSGRGKNPTDGDINLAFELLNDRYNDRSMITIISSELSAQDLLSIDEGLGSRIYERTKANYYDLTGMENWRLEH